MLALVVGLTAVSGGKPDVPAPDASEPVLSPAEGTQVPADKGFVLEITPELEMEATGETAAIAVNSGDRGAIQWQTSDPQVVTVSQDGIVTAAGFGAAEIAVRLVRLHNTGNGPPFSPAGGKGTQHRPGEAAHTGL